MDSANSIYVHPSHQPCDTKPHPNSSPNSDYNHTEVYHDDNNASSTQHQPNLWQPDSPGATVPILPMTPFHAPSSSDCHFLSSALSQSTPLHRLNSNGRPPRKLEDYPQSSPIKKICHSIETGPEHQKYGQTQDPALDLLDPLLAKDPQSEPNFKFVFEKQTDLEKSIDISLDEDLSDIEQFCESQADSSADANYSSLESSYDEGSEEHQTDQDVADLGVPVLTSRPQTFNQSPQLSRQPELQLGPAGPVRNQMQKTTGAMQPPMDPQDPRVWFNAGLPPANNTRAQLPVGQSYNVQLMHLEDEYTRGRISQRMQAVKEIDKMQEEQHLRNRKQAQQTNQLPIYGLGVHDPAMQPPANLAQHQFQLQFPNPNDPVFSNIKPQDLVSASQSSPYIPQSPYEYPRNSSLRNSDMYGVAMTSPVPFPSPCNARSPYGGFYSPQSAQNQQFYALSRSRQNSTPLKYDSKSVKQLPSSSPKFGYLDNKERRVSNIYSADFRCPSTPPPLPQLYDDELKKQMMVLKGQYNIRSSSKIPLHLLFTLMGIHDPYLGKHHEEYIIRLLHEEGFKVGYQTWVRDTSLADRRKIVDNIHVKAAKLGYCKDMIELIIRRGSYCRMQCKLRKVRRFAQQEGQWGSQECPEDSE